MVAALLVWIFRRLLTNFLKVALPVNFQQRTRVVAPPKRQILWRHWKRVAELLLVDETRRRLIL
jgi:hypothetical protein